MSPDHDFVSRAGEKLYLALKSFKLDILGKTVADFGSSTGGFVDCLLQNGASKVYAIDTAYGELAWKLRKDKRVVVVERTNAVYADFPEKMDIITIDTGWTKQEKVLPNALKWLKRGGLIISLVKPHYEAGADSLKGGKLPEAKVQEVLEEVKKKVLENDLKILGDFESPILGKRSGNVEYFLLLKKNKGKTTFPD
jgi:23S rRNA (cytidine1920-2'-O)/16S rRNA (cytidine1409-2'-O)-methyltransferase